MTVALAELAWPQARRCAPGTVLVLPLGATEQHGPHLPVGTDTAIAVGLARALARERPAEVVVAPAVAYGSSGEHAGFAGTLSIGQDAIELVIVELGRSAMLSFGRMLIISTHGGNAAPVRRGLGRLRNEGHDVRGFFPGWPHDAHAGRSETSLMLALDGDRVQLERAEAGAIEPLSELLPRLVAAGVREVSANGVLGDPAGASAQEGRDMVRAAVGRLTDLLDSWAMPA
jgi:mycofactocin system creatininase family protein